MKRSYCSAQYAKAMSIRSSFTALIADMEGILSILNCGFLRTGTVRPAAVVFAGRGLPSMKMIIKHLHFIGLSSFLLLLVYRFEILSKFKNTGLL